MPTPGQLPVLPDPNDTPERRAQLARSVAAWQAHVAAETAAGPPQIVPMAIIDGAQVPLADCDWLHVAPCGCPVGVARADAFPSEDEAAKSFTFHETAREVARDRAEGYRLLLLTRTASRPAVAVLGECPHTPRLGKHPLPDPPAKRVWAVRDVYDRPGILTKHLVEITGPAFDDARYARTYPYRVRGHAWCGAEFGHRNGAIPDWYVDDGIAHPDDSTGRRIPEVLREALECSTCVRRLRRWHDQTNPTLPGVGQ